MYYDADGLIVHRDLDGGDTAQREGWYWLGVWIRNEILGKPWPTPRALSFADTLQLLEPNRDGVFYRHPKLSPWNNPHGREFGFSRDQMLPLVAAMGVWGFLEPLHRLWNALPQDPLGGTKHTFNGDWISILGTRTVHTGDIVGPATINLFRRAWNENPLDASDGNGPGGEAELATNVALRLRLSGNDLDDTGDDLNLIIMLLMACLRYPNKMSIEVTRQYAEHRPLSYGSYLRAYRITYDHDSTNMRSRIDAGIRSGWKADVSAIAGAVRWYHREESGANPELYELYTPIIQHYFEASTNK